MKRIFPRIDYIVFFLAVVLLCGSSLGQAQANTDSPATARMRALNNSLLNLHGQMQKADANSARTLRSQAATVIAQRAGALANLIQTKPQHALSFAFSPELLADLAAKFPQSASQLESRVTVTGPVQHWIADYPKSSRSWWVITSGERKIRLFFVGPEPRTPSPGELLQATGVVAESLMAVEASSVIQSGTSSSSSADSLALSAAGTLHYWLASVLLLLTLVYLRDLGTRALFWRTRSHAPRLSGPTLVCAALLLTCVGSYAQAPPCSSTGVQKVAVLMVIYPGTAIPSYLTRDSVYAAYFGTSPYSLANYWPESSYGKTSVSGDVFGWFTLSSTSYSSADTLTQDAVNIAANSGVPIQNYNRLSLVTPDWGGNWGGLAELTCASTYMLPSGGTFTVSTSYINGTKWMTDTNNAAVIVMHELGHNLGLNHANSRAFSDTFGNPISLGPLGVAGTSQEYGDDFDAMSAGNPGHYDAPHKAMLNWMSSTNYQTVQNSGTWTIEPIETSPPGLKALKVQRGTGNNAWLWIEYRQPILNYDVGYWRDPTYMAWADQIFSGADIHYQDSLTAGTFSELLDFTPTSANGFYDPALATGQTWTDPYSNVSISVLSTTATGLTVSVNYGAAPCTHANPSVSITPLDPSTYPGVGAGYTVSITNNDSSGCSASMFSPSSSQPLGFTSAFSASSIAINPGQTSALTMTQTPPSGTVPGTYPVSASASNSSFVGTAAGNLTVVSAPSLTVSVSVSGSSFTAPSSVPIIATVLNGGSPASGANVTFTLKTPSGTATQIATTGTGGTATWNYKLNGRSPAGSYSVSAQAVLSSGTKKIATTTAASSNTVIFRVQ